MKQFYLFLFLILTVNVFLKFYGIGDHSLWLDEAYSVRESLYSCSDIIAHSKLSDNPPVYYLILHFWTMVFGISEMAVRSLSAACSIFAALFLFLFVNRSFNLKVGVTAALFFSFSSEHIFYAQETRTYAWIILLTVLSLGLFFEIIRRRSLVKLAGLTIINSILLYSHYISFIIPLIEAFVVLLFIRQNKRLFIDLFISCIITLIIFSPWISYPLTHSPQQGKFWLDKPTFSNFKGVLISFAGNKAALIICFILLGVAILNHFKRYKIKYQLNLDLRETALIILAFLPLIIIYCVAFYTPIFLLRYLLFASIPFYILFPYLSDKYLINLKLKHSVYFILILLPVFSIKLSPSKDENWKDAVASVKQMKDSSDMVFLCASYTFNVFSYYWDKNIFRSVNAVDELRNAGIYPVQTENDLPAYSSGSSKEVIALYCHEQMQDSTGTIRYALEKRFRFQKSEQFEKVKLIRYSN